MDPQTPKKRNPDDQAPPTADSCPSCRRRTKRIMKRNGSVSQPGGEVTVCPTCGPVR